MMGWVCSANLGRKREMTVRRTMRRLTFAADTLLVMTWGFDNHIVNVYLDTFAHYVAEDLIH